MICSWGRMFWCCGYVVCSCLFCKQKSWQLVVVVDILLNVFSVIFMIQFCRAFWFFAFSTTWISDNNQGLHFVVAKAWKPKRKVMSCYGKSQERPLKISIWQQIHQDRCSKSHLHSVGFPENCPKSCENFPLRSKRSSESLQKPTTAPRSHRQRPQAVKCRFGLRQANVNKTR